MEHFASNVCQRVTIEGKQNWRMHFWPNFSLINMYLLSTHAVIDAGGNVTAKSGVVTVLWKQ